MDRQRKRGNAHPVKRKAAQEAANMQFNIGILIGDATVFDLLYAPSS